MLVSIVIVYEYFYLIGSSPPVATLAVLKMISANLIGCGGSCYAYPREDGLCAYFANYIASFLNKSSFL